VAVGSVIVAVKAFPAWWVVIVTVAGGGLAVWLFSAWRLRVDSRNGRDDARRGLDEFPNLRSLRLGSRGMNGTSDATSVR
jgi:hypothetical protein